MQLLIIHSLKIWGQKLPYSNKCVTPQLAIISYKCLIIKNSIFPKKKVTESGKERLGARIQNGSKKRRVQKRACR